jgi:hypothetical protein
LADRTELVCRLTTGMASAAVVDSTLVHADGIDFILLKPMWLAIGLFVALPGIFGTLIGPAVEAVSKPDSWTAQRRRRWLIPHLAVGCFPLTVLILLIALATVALVAETGRANSAFAQDAVVPTGSPFPLAA